MNIIPGYEGKYSATESGEIYSHLSKRFLVKQVNDSGYLAVGLRHEGKTKTLRVHRLVAFAFIGAPSEKKDINHIDGDKKNNHVSNLEWCTRKENIAHAMAMGIFNSGRTTPEIAKLRISQLEKFKKDLPSLTRYSHKKGLKAWGKENGVPYKTIRTWVYKMNKGM